MKRVVGALGLAWAAANLIVGALYVVYAFVAKTAAKEGLPAQAALLAGGLLIGAFAVLLARQSYRLIVSPDGAAG